MPPTFPSFKYFTLTAPAEYIAHVEINRPEKLNAFFQPMWPELKTVFEHLSTDPEVRCVLFSGGGDKAFSAGLDLKAASSPTDPLNAKTSADPARRALHLRQHILNIQACVTAISTCSKPVIALLHGYVYGLGIDLSVACDIRLCTADARFSVKEVDIGIAADLGTLTRLPIVVGGRGSWVKEVSLTGREFRAEEAERVGFVSEVFKDKGNLVRGGLLLAEKIAGKSPLAVVGTKHLLDVGVGMGVDEHLRYTATWNASALQSADVGTAVTAVGERRRPRFAKL